MVVAKYQIFSDLHLEFHPDRGKLFLQDLEINAENVILAWDICAFSHMYSVYEDFPKKV